MTISDAGRPRFEGMVRVVRFNWPLYAIAGAAIFGCLVFALCPTIPAFPLFAHILPPVFLLVALLIFLQSFSSLIASHWVYDLSPLKDWGWLPEQCPGHKLRIVNVHSGYDETSGILLKLFPDSNISVVDLYPALERREPSIERARALYPPKTAPLCTTVNGWPIDNQSVDLILVAFAAHELRQASAREELFRQAKTVLAPEGRMILVEHLRDASNFAAFGPGYVHFYSAGEWHRCIDQAALKPLKCYKITPFVGVFVLCP